MNTFHFNTGSSTRGTIVERELSPGAVDRRRGSRGDSPHNTGDADRGPCREMSDVESHGDDDEPRGRHRSGLSAYSDAARKRASGYVARQSSTSSLQRETFHESAQISTLPATDPRRINTHVNTSLAFDPGTSSISSVCSPISSKGSSMQRNGSSIFDRSSSRWDSIATDITTPDVSARTSKASLPGKTTMEILPIPESGDDPSSSPIVEAVECCAWKPDSEQDLSVEDDDGASIDTAEETRSFDMEEGVCAAVAPTRSNQKAPAVIHLPTAPFVLSDLQVHQIRVQDFSLKTHVVYNAMDMATNIISSFPRKHRKSVFLEMGQSPGDRQEENFHADDDGPGVDVERTLRHLSISAISGNTEFYIRNDSMTAPLSALHTVAEEDGPFIFGHKRSGDCSISTDSFAESPFQERGSLPLHERAGERRDGDVVPVFKPGHRRTRAVSLGRPKTIVVLKESQSGMSGRCEDQQEEVDQAAAEFGEAGGGRESIEVSNVRDGIELES